MRAFSSHVHTVSLHVDHHQRRVSGIQDAVVRPGVGLGADERDAEFGHDGDGVNSGLVAQTE